MEAAERRHRRAYLFFSGILPIYLKPKFNMDAASAPAVEGPFLVLANHNVDYDPLFVALSFHARHMYFVASEHVYRAGVWSKLLKRYFAPVSRMKGGTASSTAMRVLRLLKKGSSVCIFAEGNRSWNGETGPIHPSTAKLVKSAGVTLVTYKLEGGYLTSPRWSASLRRGSMRGAVAGVYTPAQLSAMTVEQLGERIRADLAENAYERQKQSPVAFSGKNLAENLETALYICPVCRGIGTLRSQGDDFWCAACGTRAVYTPYGLLEGGFPYDTVLAWDRWQDGALRAYIDILGADSIAFSDEDFVLTRIEADHSSAVVDAGTLTATKRALRCGATVIDRADITEMSMFGRLSLVFTAQGVSYELRPKNIKCARKYLQFFQQTQE
ncbi:MAG: lysophospholipid acyltransferase family protein [Oscillospiraceae bacterium]|nr:lysophospholipid acyltransferase family protein [Oscillospiraceae bacterium]